MRGILLVALGAALIWLGLGRGGDTSAAGPGPGNDASAERSARDAAPPRSDWAPPPEDRLPAGGTAESDERLQAGSAASAAAAPAPALPEVLPEPPRAPVEEDLTFSGERAGVPRGSDDLPAYGLTEGDPQGLALVLLEAWIERSPTRLEDYIVSGDGSRLPAGRRQLVASFWQACMGETERAAAQLDRVEEGAGVTSEQIALLRSALRVPGSRAVPASTSARDPLARAMRMVLCMDEGEGAIARQSHADAAENYSDLIHFELDAPWPPHREALLEWGAQLERSQRNHRMSPLGRWDAVEYTVRPNDNLIGIRKRVLREHSQLLLCTGLMAAVNGIRDGHITPGDRLRFPRDLANVLVDLDARVAVLRLGTEAVQLWDVGIGREGNETPVGTYVAGQKLPNPAHTPIGGAQLPYGHPDNPLGSRWIAWNKGGRSTSFGFHGTQDPEGVGLRVSQGCVRMRNQDVEELFELLPQGARIVVQP